MDFFVKNPEAINKIGNLNREIVSKKFNWKKTAIATEQVYEQLMAK